jgi:hypothetical protein
MPIKNRVRVCSLFDAGNIGAAVIGKVISTRKVILAEENRRETLVGLL